VLGCLKESVVSITHASTTSENDLSAGPTLGGCKQLNGAGPLEKILPSKQVINIWRMIYILVLL